MTPRDTALALGAGAVSALASVALAAGSFGAMVIACLAPLPLFLVGLSQGPRFAAIAAAAGFMVAGILGGTIAAGLFGLLHALPTWMVVRLSLSHRQTPDGTVQWYPAGAVMGWLTLLGAGLFLAAAAALWGEDGFLAAVQSHLDQAFRLMTPALAEADRETVLGTLVPLFPSAVGTSWVVMTAINAVLAQAILTRSGKSLRPSPGYADLRLPDWASWALVAAAAAALLGSGDVEYVGRNLTVILAVPFFFLGLAVAHGLARRSMYGTMLLGAFYLVLLVSGWMMLLVAGVGVLEQWVGLRERFAGPAEGETPQDGEES